MNNFETILDFGSKNLRLAIFDEKSKNIYSSSEAIEDNLEKSLNILIRDAEKFLSNHIANLVVLYDSPKFYCLDLSIKKSFDGEVSIKNTFSNLIEEASFIVSQNNFKSQIIHIVVNNIRIDKNEKIEKIVENIKIKSLTLDIKFICIDKIFVNKISDILKKNNLKITNLYCSSYVKTNSYKKKFDDKNHIFFLDIGHNRSSAYTYINSKLETFKSIPIGSNNITKDISEVLKLDLDYSEQLKKSFNNKEEDIIFGNKKIKNDNLYSQILKKNISIDLLKQVIQERIDEILELVIYQNMIIKNFNRGKKPKVIFIGNGSKILSTFYKNRNHESLLEINLFDDNDLAVCEAGHKYHVSNESYLNKAKVKTRKYGFFESFFNVFSK